MRTTKAVDLLVDASDENIRAVKRALATLPDNAAADADGLELREVLGVLVPVASKPLRDSLPARSGSDG